MFLHWKIEVSSIEFQWGGYVEMTLASLFEPIHYYKMIERIDLLHFRLQKEKYRKKYCYYPYSRVTNLIPIKWLTKGKA